MILSRDFLSRFWKVYTPFRKVKMYNQLKTNKQNLIIHTPGKVGSTSVYVTLKQVLAYTHNVFHFHFLSKDGITGEINTNLNSNRKSLPLHLIDSQQYARFFNHNYDEDLKVIILLRESVNRYISETYQNLNKFFPKKHNADVKEINDYILSGLQNNEHITIVDNWFDIEVKGNFGIDVYKNDDLVRRDGYWYFKNGNTDLYIINLEDLNGVFTKFCKNELNLPNCELVNSNVGNNKSYSDKYKQTKKNLDISEDIISKTKESKYYKRFYLDSDKS